MADDNEKPTRKEKAVAAVARGRGKLLKSPEPARPFTDIIPAPKEPPQDGQFFPDLREMKAGRGNRSMGMDQQALFFGGDTFATAILKLLMTGKLVVQYHDYAGGTTGGPESDSDVENGMIYLAKDYGAVGTHKLFARIGGAWKSVTLA